MDDSAMNAIKELKKSIVIDEEVFDRNVVKLQELVDDIIKLRNDVADMLETLKTGFDTPAGRKFLGLCKDQVIQPLNQQRIVIGQISDNLKAAKNGYQSIFEEYRQLAEYASE